MNILDMTGTWSKLDARVYNLVIAPALAKLYDSVCERFMPRDNLHDGMSLLDVGCGAGHLPASLGRRFPTLQIQAVDLADEMVARAREATRGLDNVTVSQADALQLPFGAEQFDFAISVASIKHWPDRVRGLQEIFRVLRPGGRLYIIEVFRGASLTDAMAFLKHWRFATWPLPFLFASYFRRFVAGHGLAASELEAFCHRAGFADLNAETYRDYLTVMVRCRKPAAPEGVRA